jgi:ribosomal protein L32
MEYKELKVVIKSRKKIVITKPNRISLSGDVQIDSLTERLITVFRKLLAEDKIKSREELVVLGSYLFNGLFDEETRRVFWEEYKKISNKEQEGLRVVLEFEPEARDLAVLPWEYIYYPDSTEEGRGFFIATDNQLILARHVPLKMQGLSPSPKPLRILIVVSTPARDEDGEKELGIIDEGLVIETICQLGKKSPTAIQVEQLESPVTKTSLTNWIQANERYHVVHFVGHGKYDKDGGSLALASARDPGRASWIKEDALADCFRKREPRLIFLNACKGAYSGSYAAFQGVALKLVYSNIPAVVALQFEVENKVANLFAEKFYQSLGEGKPIDVAVQDGRSKLGMFLDEDQNYSNRAFGSPVVYLQSAEGIVIAEAQPEKKDYDLLPKVICPHGDCPELVSAGDNFCGDGHPLVECQKCGKIMVPNKSCHACGWRHVSLGEPIGADVTRRATERIPVQPPSSDNATVQPELQPIESSSAAQSLGQKDIPLGGILPRERRG